ncbi:MAG: 50S ribosomal protein L6, partial [Balneolaceae bacterium]
MSRIGNQPVPIAENTEFSIDAENVVTVKGARGTSRIKVHPNISVEKADGELLVKRSSDTKENRSLHGLYRSLIHNLVIGVNDGFTK